MIVEEALDGFIEASLFNPSQLNSVNPNFYTKGHLALSLSMDRDRDHFWAVFWAVNQLRNKIAHRLDSPEIDEKMKHLRKCYIDMLSPEQVPHAKSQSDKEIVDAACLVCAGFLATLKEDAKARRRTIDENWKGRT